MAFTGHTLNAFPRDSWHNISTIYNRDKMTREERNAIHASPSFSPPICTISAFTLPSLSSALGYFNTNMPHNTLLWQCILQHSLWPDSPAATGSFARDSATCCLGLSPCPLLTSSFFPAGLPQLCCFQTSPEQNRTCVETRLA